MKPISLTVILVMLVLFTNAQVPHVASGTIVHYTNFKSKFVDERNVDVWLPPGYTTKKKYPVLYMHDGQMLFDSTITWNKQSWHVTETMTRLIKTHRIKACIVVGIWNVPAKRFSDYFPQKALAYLSETDKTSLLKTQQGFTPDADQYLKFLVTELKPFIDKTYKTQKDKAHTFIMGSSMGGLISAYAICEYPQIYGGAACLSTHWPGLINTKGNSLPEALFSYLKATLPTPAGHRIYFDHGSKTLDSLYQPLQQQVDGIMHTKGFNSQNWETKTFPGADHSEASWSKRLGIPLAFLLGR